MPLRDHFRPPLDLKASWEELHSQWPAIMVQHLKGKLPAGYVAAPGIHLGTQVEVDIAMLEKDEAVPEFDRGGGGTALAIREPDIAVEMALQDYDEYEVRIYDAKRGRQLVAAIEIVSPGNKDRPEARNAFVAKCAALLRKGVAVSVVDLVTVRHANLCCELMVFLGQENPKLCDDPPSIYTASCRWMQKGKRQFLQCWSDRLELDRPLPTLPLWLRGDLGILFDLEASYEQACDDLSLNV